jgi:hypothetical protein
MPEFLNTQQGALPAAADSVSATSGAIGTYGSYVQITASAPSDLAVTGIATHPGGFSPNTYMTMEVAHGAGGSEVALAEFGGWVSMLSGSWFPDSPSGVIPALIPVKTITSGTRIACRVMRGDSGNTQSCAVTYVGLPLDGNLETTTSPLRVTAFVSATSGGSAWTSGSWVQVNASTSAAWVINHLVTAISASSGFLEVGLGTGAGGAETEIAAFATYSQSSLSGNPNAEPLGLLLDNIAAATRVAVRLRADAASLSANILFGYYHKPL